MLTSSPALVGSGDLPVLVWVLAGGFGTACQQAVNGQLMRRSGDAVVAALVSFAVGSLALLAVVAVIRPQLTWPTTWWLYTGGSYAAVYIVISAAVVGRLGVFRLTLAAVGGQLTGALILDLVSPVAGRHVTWQTVLGTALAVGAVAIAAPRSRGVATTAR